MVILSYFKGQINYNSPKYRSYRFLQIFCYKSVQMTNPFSFQEQPCLDFLHNDTPQSNSLLAHIMVKQQQNQPNNFTYNYMEYQRYNSHLQSMYRQDRDEKSSKLKTKEKKKVFYRDKMAQLMSEENYIKPEYNYVDFAQFQKGKSPLSRDEQLKRNRQSAKQSRQRKKEYVQTLEQKIKLSQKQVTQLTQRLRQTQLQRDRLKQSNNAHVQSYNQVKGQVYDKLSQIIEAPQNQQRNKDIQQCLNDMKEKFGSAGKERVSLVNYYMSEIIENLITDFQKYFINCAIANTGIFSDAGDAKDEETVSKINLEIRNILEITQPKKKNVFVGKFRDRFKKEAMLFNNICQQLYQSFNSLISQSSILDNIFNDMRKEFEPQMVAKLILYFEENKYRKDLRKMRNQWYENFSRNEQEITDSIRKLTKRYD